MTQPSPISDRPQVLLGNWPSPVRRLEIASAELGVDVWAKVEDASGTWCANKARKLEYLLGEARARGRDRLFAYGVGSSTWCAAAARYGIENGFSVHVAVAGRIPGQLKPAYEGAALLRLPTYASLPLVAVIGRARARAAHRMPAGGSSRTGDLGSARAGLEIAAAVDEGSLPAPRRVFVAAGTCGTAAGLVVGMTAGGHPTELCAVRVTPRPLGTRSLLQRRVRRLTDVMQVAADAPIAAVVDDRFHPPGYGRPSRSSEEAQAIAARDGLELDATYGAKAFAAVIAAARSGVQGPLLFVSTSPIGTLRG